jgi:hypothetical protein
LFRRPGGNETILSVTKPFFASEQNSGNAAWLSRAINNGGKPVAIAGDSQMRTLSVILAFACLLAGPSIAGSVDNSLPGVGTFAYTGSPVVTSAAQAMVVAVR